MYQNLKSATSKLNILGRAVLDIAISHAASQHHIGITPEHLLMAIARRGNKLLQSLGMQAGAQVLPSYGKRVISWVAKHSQLKQSGTRDIDQVLNQYLQPKLATRILQEPVVDSFKIDISNNEMTLCTQKEAQ